MKTYLLLLLFILSINNINAQTYADTTWASNDTICYGDEVSFYTLFADTVLLFEDFNDSIINGLSYTCASSDYIDCYNAMSEDTIGKMWVGNNSTFPRNIETINYNITGEESICFEFKLRMFSGSPECNGAHEKDEGVSIQYSTDNGTAWNDIKYFCPDGQIYPNNSWIGTSESANSQNFATNFTDWQYYCVDIPVAAASNNTKFRLHQEQITDSTYGHWGIDNLQIKVRNNDSIKWYRNGTLYKEMTETSFPTYNNHAFFNQLYQNTEYYSVIFHDNTTDTIFYNIRLKSTPFFTLSNDSLCIGDTLIATYTGNASDTADYYWWNNNSFWSNHQRSFFDILPNSTDTVVYFAKHFANGYLDSYDIRLLDNFIRLTITEGSCQTSLAIPVSTFPKKHKPFVFNNTNSIHTATHADSYKWYLNNSLLANETQQTLQNPQNGGNYKVEVTNIYGCSTMSDEVTHQLTGNYTANVNPLEICIGDSVSLFASNLNNFYSDYLIDFNTGTDSLLLETNAIINNPCTTVGDCWDGSYFWWFDDPYSPLRTVTTKPIDIQDSSIICFDFKMGHLGNNYLCLGPNRMGTGITFQWSIDTGNYWISTLPNYEIVDTTSGIISYFSPSGAEHFTYIPFEEQIEDCEIPFYYWDTYCYDIPDSVCTNHTKFRWVAAGYDSLLQDTVHFHWGLDNIYIYSTKTINIDSVNWYENGNFLSNEYTPAYQFPIQNTTYSAVIDTGLGTDSIVFNVIVNQLPTTPIISQNGNLLTSTVENYYQWYFYDTLLNGANNQNYTVINQGTYFVEVTNQYGCSAISDSIYVLISSLSDLQTSNNVLLYPNPTSGLISLSFNVKNESNVNIKIFDNLGQLMYNKAYKNVNNRFLENIDLSEFKKGIYSISINVHNKIFTKHIVVN